MEPLELVVAGRERVAADTLRLSLRRSDGGPLPAAEPGAHVVLDLAGLVRRYSLLSCSASPTRYEIGVLLAPKSRGGSRHVHERLMPGSRLMLLDVANEFALDAQAPHVLLLGGGIGVTPLLGMAARLAAEGRGFALHQVVRDADRQWRWPAGLQATVHVGRSGLDLHRLIAEQPPGSHAYVCGPAGLVAAVRAAARDLDWAPQRIHSESFGAVGDPNDAALRVTLTQSGLTLDVAPGTSLLDALLAAGVWTAHECRRGTCGSCLAAVVRGRPIHRDSLAEGMRGAAMCTCVSWAEGPELELDL